MSSPTMAPLISVEEFEGKIGTSLGHSDWCLVDQAKINDFADVSGDHQFIHVDPVRAKAETAFGGTIAHGFLTLSLLPTLSEYLRPDVKGCSAKLNYGFEKIRFLTPVPSGARIRAALTLAGAERRKPTELLARWNCAIEIENMPKPALIAEWLTMYVMG